MDTPPPVPSRNAFKISRAGKIVLELEGSAIFQAMLTGQVLLTDHYWTAGMSDWATVGSRKDWDSLAEAAAPPVSVMPVSAPRRSVTGRVLEFNVAASSGLISGNDGMRYAFSAQEWRSHGVLPQPGVQVDFETDGKSAFGIFAITGARGVPVVAGGTPEGFYRSSDDKLLGGVCAGLAHKWGSNTVLIRIIALFVPIGIPIYIVMWISVPERATRS